MSSDKRRTTAKDFEAHYTSSRGVSGDGPKTKNAEQTFRQRAALNELVDPSAYGVIRIAVARMEQIGRYWKLLFGLPLPIESTFDTTASMGTMVDVIFEQLPREYDLMIKLLNLVGCPYDLQIANGNFNDRVERPVICRSMFEMGTKIADQLTHLVPVRDGGDVTEDPDYAIFGAGFLTQSTADLFKLKGYHFTVTDAPARGTIDSDLLIQIFGKDVFAHASVNDPDNILARHTNKDIPTHVAVKRLLQRAHGFAIVVGSGSDTSFWQELYGRNRVIHLHNPAFLPEMKTTIIGLTEGILDFDTAIEFLTQQQVQPVNARQIVSACLNITLPRPADLETKRLLPKPGDFFNLKLGLEMPANPNDLVPIPADSIDLTALTSTPGGGSTFNWK